MLSNGKMKRREINLRRNFNPENIKIGLSLWETKLMISILNFRQVLDHPNPSFLAQDFPTQDSNVKVGKKN